MDLAIELVGALALVLITLIGTVLAVAFATRDHCENLVRGARFRVPNNHQQGMAGRKRERSNALAND